MATGDLESAGCSKCMIMVQDKNVPLRYDSDVEIELTGEATPDLSSYASNIRQLTRRIHRGQRFGLL